MISLHPSRWPLWVHVAGVACVLVVASAFVGHRAYVFLDEAALLAQVEIVGRGEWTVDRPYAELDPGEALAPMARSTVVGDRFAPFPNHPLHVQVASVADGLGSRSGLALLSVLGVVGAAAAAGRLASSVGRAHAAVAVWATALLSPLVFDANLVLAHAVAAAGTGALFLAAFRWSGRGDGARLAPVAVAAFGLGLVGALLRSEVVLLTGVVAAVACARALVDREPRRAVPGVAAAVGGLAAYLLEPRWIEHLVGTSAGRKTIAESSRGGVPGAADGAWKVLLEPGDPASVALVVAVSLAVASVLLLRARPTEPVFALVTAAVAAVAATVHLGDPLIVSGLLWAFPLLPVAVAAAGRSANLPTDVGWAAIAAVAFGAAVLATQYRVGGGVEWGWRYFAVALPAVCAALSVPVVRLWRTARSGTGQVAVIGVLAVCVLVPASGLLAQRRVVDRTDRFLTALDEAIADADASLVLAADSSLGRFAWERSIAGEVITIGRDGAGLELAAEALPREPMLLVYVGEPPPLPPGFAIDGEARVLLAGAYAAVPVRFA